MYVCMHVRMYVCMCVCYICRKIDSHRQFRRGNMCMYTHTYACTYVHIYESMYVRIYVCMCVCVRLYIRREILKKHENIFRIRLQKY